jgi:predicted metalloendopeptidase
MNDEVKDWQKLGKPRDIQQWEMYPSMVNAYFNPPANEVCARCRPIVRPSDYLYT